MQGSRRVVVAALVLALLVAPILAACREPPPPGPAAPPAWDRDAARLEVFAATLDVMGEMRDGDETPGEVLVVDDTLRPHGSHYDEKFLRLLPPVRSEGMASLPDGRKVLRPQIDALAAATFDDWAAHITPSAAPSGVGGKRAIEWLSEASWDALELRPNRSTWPAFRKRFPRSSAWIHLSDVGFSPSHEQALLQAEHDMDATSSGSWLLLERKANRWTVAKRRRTFIACGAPSEVITPSDDDLRVGR